MASTPSVQHGQPAEKHSDGRQLSSRVRTACIVQTMHYKKLKAFAESTQSQLERVVAENDGLSRNVSELQATLRASSVAHTRQVTRLVRGPFFPLHLSDRLGGLRAADMKKK